MNLTDTHCHIHEDDYGLDPDETIISARDSGVGKLICVGTTAGSSVKAAEFVKNRDNVWFSIGQHPHEAKDFGETEKSMMKSLVGDDNLVAVGECGLDYWYSHSSKPDQEECLRWQLDLASQNNLPVIFHNRGSKDNPRDAFDDLWRILDGYKAIRGVVHSFSADSNILEQILERDLIVGINGIMTFTKDSAQLEALDAVPLDKILLETDAPYLTPPPFRGSINEPKHLVEVAKFIANRKGVNLKSLAKVTSETVSQIFSI